MSDWTEVEVRETRIRYREREQYAVERFEVEYWHDTRHEWRAARNVSSRDWFAVGYAAGQQAARNDPQLEIAV